MNKRLLALAVSIVVLFIGSFVLRSAFEGEAEDAGKSTAAVSEMPRNSDSLTKESEAAYTRIVSLAPSITETLFALGLGSNVVGVTRYCDFPDAAKTKTQVGGYYDPNNEAIVALDPNLVVLFREHAQTQRVLARANIEYLVVSHNSISEILESIVHIGNKMGKNSAAAKKAATLVSSLRAEISEMKQKEKKGPVKTVMISTGRNMGTGKIEDAYITGKEGFYNEMIQIVGAKNAYQGDVAFPVVSNEGILRMNPDVIIDMVPDLEEQQLSKSAVLNEWRQLQKLKAVKTEQVHILTDDYVVVPGPRFIMLLKQLDHIVRGVVRGVRSEAEDEA